MAERSTHSLDWVDRFEGASAYLKRRPLPPATWAQLQADIESIPQHLPVGAAQVLISGSMRLATAFAVGGALRMVTGSDLMVNQRGQLWTSTARSDACDAPVCAEYPVGFGNELAVAVGVAANPLADVLRFIGQEHLPVARLVLLTPATGVRDDALPDAAAAAAFARGCRDAVRALCRHCPRIHLFNACPMGLALLLGHRWNRMRPTVVYEDVQGEYVYERAFFIDA
jgi:hypothetical protein